MAEITSRPYKPDAKQCCEACAFGRGEHAAWCERSGARWISRMALLVMTKAEFDALEIIESDYSRQRCLVRDRGPERPRVARMDRPGGLSHFELACGLLGALGRTKERKTEFDLGCSQADAGPSVNREGTARTPTALTSDADRDEG